MQPSPEIVALISNRNQVRTPPRPDGSFTVSQTKHLGWRPRHHVERLPRCDAAFANCEAYLVEQVAGRSQRRIAAQRNTFHLQEPGSDKMATIKEFAGRRAHNQGRTFAIDPVDVFIFKCEAVD